jgi:hypothetical protein
MLQSQGSIFIGGKVLEMGRREFSGYGPNKRENQRQSFEDRKEGKLQVETIPP